MTLEDLKNEFALKNLKKEFEMVRSNRMAEKYSDNYFANPNGCFSCGLGNETLAFKVFKRNDKLILCDLIEIAYIGKELKLGMWYFYDVLKQFIKPEGGLVKRFDLKVLKSSPLKEIELLSKDIKVRFDYLKKINKKVIYQNRIDWQRKEQGKSVFYRKRLAIRTAPLHVIHIRGDLNGEETT